MALPFLRWWNQLTNTIYLFRARDNKQPAYFTAFYTVLYVEATRPLLLAVVSTGGSSRAP
jgi:hypothetical protein